MFEYFLFYSIPLVISFALALMATWWVRRFALVFGIVDDPGDNQRKIHSTAMPLLGGVAVYGVITFLTIVFWRAGWLASDRIQDLEIIGLLIASTLIVIGGVLDDIYTLKPWQQFIWPLSAVLVVLLSGLSVGYVTDPRGGVLTLLPIVQYSLTFVWLLGMSYTTKILDGLDGLVGGIGAIGACIIFIVSLSWNEPFSAVSVLALMVVGTLLGFLVFNFHPASIFLGESGSVLIGFWLGILSIIAGSKIATALLIMGVPIIDLAWTIFRRLVVDHTNITASDRKHLHHRLFDMGIGHRRAVLLMYVLTLLFGTVALWQDTKGKIIGFGILALCMVYISWYTTYRVVK